MAGRQDPTVQACDISSPAKKKKYPHKQNEEREKKPGHYPTNAQNENNKTSDCTNTAIPCVLHTFTHTQRVSNQSL